MIVRDTFCDTCEIKEQKNKICGLTLIDNKLLSVDKKELIEFIKKTLLEINKKHSIYLKNKNNEEDK